MKRSTKKGFTIVELVIVIAIIAILAAVLIPTFASLIQKANESKDTQLVKNLNTALAANGKEHKTMTEALAAAAEFGYDVGKINASATGNEILWDSENDVFCYFKDGKVEYIPETSLKNGKPADYKLWKIYTEAPAEQTFSIYWNSDKAFDKELTVGFDAGKCTAITALKYERTGEDVTPQEVVIRTSSGETNLTVDAANDTVMHYGAAGVVNVLAVDKTHSYHEFGSVHTLEAKSGHIVLESGSLVYKLEKADNSADATFVSNGTVVKKAAGIEGVTVSETYDIYNLEQLCAFRDHVNAGMTFDALVIEIKADIDMSSVSWLPIGTAKNPFYGEIRGNGHTLTGLTNGTINLEDVFTTDTTKTRGTPYGFIGIAGAKAAGQTLKVSDLNFADVNISLGQYGNCVGTLLGYAPSTSDFESENKFNEKDSKGLSDVEIENVNVLGGKVEAYQDAGGICGKLYNENNATIKNCENSATITSLLAADKACRAGGIVSYASLSGDKSKLVVENCTNNGKITSNHTLAGVVSFGFSEKKVMAIEVTGCNNKGDLVWNGGNAENYWVAYIASCASTDFNSAKAGCSYNFGDETTKNTNSGKVITPNFESGALDTIFVGLSQGAVGSANDANGKNATKK